jgi:dUTP pyrophosphatase
MKLQFKKLHPNAQLPTRGSEHAAGYDLYAVEYADLHPGQRSAIATGIAVAVPDGYYGRIAPRSGVAASHGIDCLAGVVDPDYRGEVKVLLINLNRYELFNVPVGDRIAQLILEKFITPEPEWADDLPDTCAAMAGLGAGVPQLYKTAASIAN